MEDIGDILFYIIAAVIGLVTTLGRKKKKPAGTPLPAKDEETGDIEYLDEEQEYDIDEEPFTDQERVISYEPTYQYSFDHGNEGDFIEPIAEKLESLEKSQISEEEILKEEIVDNIEEEEDIISYFDLRQAVIYSEILKRNDY